MPAIPRPDLVRLRHMLDAAQKAQEFMLGRTRNRLIHGYFNVDLDVLWRGIEEDVPALRDTVRRILADHSNASTSEDPI